MKWGKGGGRGNRKRKEKERKRKKNQSNVSSPHCIGDSKLIYANMSPSLWGKQNSASLSTAVGNPHFKGEESAKEVWGPHLSSAENAILDMWRTNKIWAHVAFPPRVFPPRVPQSGEGHFKNVVKGGIRVETLLKAKFSYVQIAEK